MIKEWKLNNFRTYHFDRREKSFKYGSTKGPDKDFYAIPKEQ
jgi:hypothetical protein